MSIRLYGTRAYPLLRPLIDRWRTSRAYAVVLARRERREVQHWAAGARSTLPPPGAKHAVIARYADEFGLRVLVETGTHTGGTVLRLLRRFDRIVSIELDPALAERAQQRFSRFGHVEILHGDSAELLPAVVSTLRRPALFWLDAHYSGGITARGPKETPIAEELECILDSEADHVVLIDDAREFTGEREYPALDEIRALVAGRLDVNVADDIVRLTPPRAS